MGDSIMATTINADTSEGLKLTSDTSGELELQSAGTTKAKVTSSGLTDASGQLISNTPAFSVKVGTNQSLSDSTVTKIDYDTEEFDTDNTFDTSTNRFTVPSGKAGKYVFNATARFDSEGTGNLGRTQLKLFKNGSTIKQLYPYYADGYIRTDSLQLTAVLDLAVGDYIEVYGYLDAIDNSGGIINANSYSFFSGHKLII